MSTEQLKQRLSTQVAEGVIQELAKTCDIPAGRRRRKVMREIENLAYIEIDRAVEALSGQLAAEIAPKVQEKICAMLEADKKRAERMFRRFSVNVLVQHWIMAISVIILIFTGMPLKFANAPFWRGFMDLIGGIEVSRILHRIGATGLIWVSVYHLFYISFTKEGRQNFKELLPKPKDATDAWMNIKYFLGMSKEKPKFGRFSYVEKFDYWAVYWGCVIMIFSGTVLWYNNFFMRNFPLIVQHLAKIMHSDEALLATLAIVIWHMYNAHLNPSKFPANMVIFTGKLSEEEMIEEHPLEYEQLMAQNQEASDDQK